MDPPPISGKKGTVYIGPIVYFHEPEDLTNDCPTCSLALCNCCRDARGVWRFPGLRGNAEPPALTPARYVVAEYALGALLIALIAALIVSLVRGHRDREAAKCRRFRLALVEGLASMMTNPALSPRFVVGGLRFFAASFPGGTAVAAARAARRHSRVLRAGAGLLGGGLRAARRGAAGNRSRCAARVSLASAARDACGAGCRWPRPARGEGENWAGAGAATSPPERSTSPTSGGFVLHEYRRAVASVANDAGESAATGARTYTAYPFSKGDVMTKKLLLLLVAFSLASPTMMLAGCNTVEGAGKDVAGRRQGDQERSRRAQDLLIGVADRSVGERGIAAARATASRIAREFSWRYQCECH